MWKIALLMFILSFCIFAGIMLYDSRTLWSGVSFLSMMMCLTLFLFFIVSQYAGWLAAHDLVTGILVAIFILAVCSIILFPAILILVFFVEGIRVIRHEGIKPANLLSMLFSVSLCIYLAVWPTARILKKTCKETGDML